MRTIAIVGRFLRSPASSGCGGTDRRQSVNPAATTSAPPYHRIAHKNFRGELCISRRASTPSIPKIPKAITTGRRRKVYQRSFSGRLPHDGGIFVSKRDQRKLRGYVIMPGGLTHVGNLLAPIMSSDIDARRIEPRRDVATRSRPLVVAQGAAGLLLTRTALAAEERQPAGD